MTNNELDGLFATARNTPADTSVKEVTAWVGMAAAATVGLSVLAKLKLIFIKKSIIMITGSIITSGIVAGVVILSSTNPTTPEKLNSPSSKIVQSTVDDSAEQMKNDPVFVFDSTKGKKKLVLAPDPLLPIAPLEPINPLLNIQPVQPIAPVMPIAKKRSPAQDFHTVHIDGIYDVVIKQGSASKVEVEKNGMFTGFTDYEVKDGVFCTDCSDELTDALLEGGVLHITITKNIREIHHEGVGNLKSGSMIKVEKLRLKLHGVGDTELELECTSLNVEFNGVGDVKLIGASNSGEVSYCGVGDFKGYDFIFESLKVTHNGVGNVQVNATRSINITANGVGNVYYKGNPSEKEIANNAIGKVKQK